MNTTKKLFALMLIGVLLVVSFVPSTFSWYPHNDSEEGKSIHYADNLELSLKTAANAVSMSTVPCDASGNVPPNSSAVNTVSVSPGNVGHYKTTLTNAGTDDVMLDFETSNLPNNADFAIGTTSPTLNEKAFASRAVRGKSSDAFIRVYFKTNTNFSSFWYNGKDVSGYTTLDTNNVGSSSNNTTCDINIAYSVGGTVSYQMMNKCPTADTNWSSTGTKVYYYDVPSSADYFFFFNHWYMKLADDDNRLWNCTINITDLSAGKLYYLTGKSINEAGSEKWKEYKARDVDHTLVAVNNYYKSVRMSLGESIFADISLKKDSVDDDEEFVPDYYGSSISYSVISGSNYVSVNKDGLITPKAAGTATVRTTITGRYGDTRTLDTTVNIPQNIDQVPIIKNVRVPAGESVDIYWYARNNSATESLTTDALFVTI